MLNAVQLRALRSATGNRLRFALDLAGVTQVEFAEATGYSQQYISAILNGNFTKLPLVTAQELAKYFGCRADDLFPPAETTREERSA